MLSSEVITHMSLRQCVRAESLLSETADRLISLRWRRERGRENKKEWKGDEYGGWQWKSSFFLFLQFEGWRLLQQRIRVLWIVSRPGSASTAPICLLMQVQLRAGMCMCASWKAGGSLIGVFVIYIAFLCLCLTLHVGFYVYVCE